MQDDAVGGSSGPRYTDTELGIAFDRALQVLGEARPVLTTLLASVPASRSIRLDTLLAGCLFGSIVLVRDVTAESAAETVVGWSYYEAGGEHYLLLPWSLAVGATVEILVRGGYGFGLNVILGGVPATIDNNVPVEWRELLLDGAEGFALELYGQREVGRANIPPAVAQQNARAAAVKLRDFRQALAHLPFADAQRAIVTWSLDEGKF
jgi:hypothetical protein